MPLKPTRISAFLRNRPARSSSPARLALSFLVAASLFLAPLAGAKTRWTELNIGPFYIDASDDPGAARELLVQLEQVRWVLGNLLEEKDLRSLWPIRIMLAGKHSAGATGAGTVKFVSQNSQFVCVLPAGSRAPIGEIAGLLLDANTPRLPAEVEAGLRQLFSTLEAHGSRVTWGGGPPSPPDLAWARMQLFATKFEYGASFHIFLTALRSGSTLAAAERNAFAKPVNELEREAAANLASGHWTPTPVSGRPLDPKRDFGEHTLDEAAANVFLAAYRLPEDKPAVQTAFQTAVDTGVAATMALGYEGLAQLAKVDRSAEVQMFQQNAIHSGSHSATVYLEAASDLPPAEALPLIRRAAQLNERWAEPVFAQAAFAENPAEKEALLKTGLKLDPRNTTHWIALAELQTGQGQGTAAQGSWLRAEDSAPDEAERDRVHQLRLSYEQQRLDAAADAVRRDRDAAHLADQQAQQAEAERIRAAEQKANGALDQTAGGQQPSDVVAWNSLAGEKKLKGTLTRIDCLRSGWRLFIRDSAGHPIQLFLGKDSAAALPCNTAAAGRRVTLQYRPASDEDLHTSGEITNLQMQ